MEAPGKLEGALVLMGTICFPTLYFVAKSVAQFLPPQEQWKRNEFAVRAVSAVQAIFSVVIGILAMKNTATDIVFARYPALNYYIWFWLPYFYYDAWAMFQVYLAKHPNGDTCSNLKGFFRTQALMMVHHILLPVIYGPAILTTAEQMQQQLQINPLIRICIVEFSYGVKWYFRNNKGDYLIGCALLMETTVPFISLRYILLGFNMKASAMYIVNGVLLTISFGTVRIALWFYMIHVYAVYKNVSFSQGAYLLPSVCKGGTVLFFLMNLYWFIRIASIFFHSVRDLLKQDESYRLDGIKAK